MKAIWLGLLGCATLVSACGDHDDKQAACDREKQLTADVEKEAVNVDGLSTAKGLCLGSEADIAARLRQLSATWASADESALAERAHQYFVNCQKISDAKAECGD
jgi:hypothetical protein